MCSPVALALRRQRPAQLGHRGRVSFLTEGAENARGGRAYKEIAAGYSAAWCEIVLRSA